MSMIKFNLQYFAAADTNIELVETYQPYVDEQFALESKISMVTNQDFKFDGTHSIRIYRVTTAGMNDYIKYQISSDIDRLAGFAAYGIPETLDAVTDRYELNKDRSFTFVIDALDTDETGNALEAAAALARQNREKVIPEVDANAFAVMAAKAGFKAAAKELNNFNIYKEITSATVLMDDALVPAEGRVLIVSSKGYEALKQCPRIVLNTDVGQDMRVKGVISNLDGMQVVKIPAARLPENFGFMICHPMATVAPTKLISYKIHENPPGVNGSLVEGRIVYDAFVLKNKAKAIYYQEATSINHIYPPDWVQDKTETTPSGEGTAAE